MKTSSTSISPSGTTIKDISKAMNVSATTVHRALNGKEGLSNDLRERILAAAREMGYSHNYAASAIKRKAIRIAVILPAGEGGGGMYYAYFWKGYRRYWKEISALNVVTEEFPVNGEMEQAAVLKRIADQGPEAYQGVLTYSYTRIPEVLNQLQRLTAQRIAVVVLDDQLKDIEGLCCISPSERIIGELCAEFLDLATPDEGTMILSGGRQNSRVHTNTTQSFVEYMAQNKPRLKVVQTKPYTVQSSGRELMDSFYQVLIAAENPVGIFSLTSLENEPMVMALDAAGLTGKIRTVGSDLYRRSAECLEAGIFHAIIYKNPFDKGYEAFRILTDCVIKRIAPPQNASCIMSMVFKSSLVFYEDMID